MMEMSRRARRMERNHKRNKQPALNLVSLMDVFTILVFFLLVSSSNVQQLPKKKTYTCRYLWQQKHLRKHSLFL